MAFCSKCGAQVQDGAGFCPACGQAMAAAPPQQPQQPYQEPQQQYQQPQQQYQQPQQQYQQPQQQYQQPQQQYQPQYQQPYDDVQNNKVMAILSYFGILFLIPLATGAHKTSPFVKFHLNQGIVLAIVMVGWGVVYGVLTGIVTAIFFASIYAGAIGSIIIGILGLAWFFPAVLCILGIVNAATGKMKQLPLIGKFTIIK